MATSQDQQLHFVLLPQMGQGHLIPMIDMARLFAERGVIVTIVTTPLESFKFKSIIDRAKESGGLPIRLLQLESPSPKAEVKLGCQNKDTVPIKELIKNFFTAAALLHEPLEQCFGDLQPSPSCIISDVVFPWTAKTAMKFQIPRIFFNGFGCCSLLCCHNMLRSKLHESIISESEPFVIPGLPDRIEITKTMLPMDIYNPSPDDQLKDFSDQIKEAELTTYGIIVNSFQELEPKYAESYLKAKNNKVWCIGPVSLCNKETKDKAERGNKPSIEENQCLKWLDSKNPYSVVYACFGSLCNLTSSEMMEVGLGLESSGRPFVWVISGGGKYSDLEEWLSKENFEVRNKDKGLVIKGWAPQVLILSHGSIGGFLTHCGWNSVLEGVCAGVPLITWPMGAEQFLNEKLIVQVLGIGVRAVGVDDVPASETKLVEEEKKNAWVMKKREQVGKAVNKVMDGGEEGEMRRRKVRELAEMAKKAMEEGGSSHFNMTLFIQDMMQYQARKELPIQVKNTA